MRCRREAAERETDRELAFQQRVGVLMGFDDAEETANMTVQQTELAIEPDDEPAAPAFALEPDEPAAATVAEPTAPTNLARIPLVEILPPDFQLSPLTKFVPNGELRRQADEDGTAALALAVTGAEGIAAADAALAGVRARLEAIEEHFAEPVAVAYDLHKRLTTIRADWCARGKEALDRVGRRMYDEHRRLEAIAAKERRQAQAEADRQAREAKQREADEAKRQQAPPAVVEHLEQQAATATAPPVPASVAAPPPLKASTTVARWRARLAGTPASEDPNPSIEALTPDQRTKVFEAMRAVLEGKAPLVLFDLNWSYLNKRAAAEKAAFAIPGFDAFDDGSVRARSTRAAR